MNADMSPFINPEMIPLMNPEISPLMNLEISSLMNPNMRPLIDPEISRSITCAINNRFIVNVKLKLNDFNFGPKLKYKKETCVIKILDLIQRKSLQTNNFELTAPTCTEIILP